MVSVVAVGVSWRMMMKRRMKMMIMQRMAVVAVAFDVEKMQQQQQQQHSRPKLSSDLDDYVDDWLTYHCHHCCPSMGWGQ